MSFGEKHLKKLGWKEGQGLGITNGGIKKPISVSKKKKKEAGLGAEKHEWQSQWWENVYNTASQNVQIVKDPNTKVGSASNSGGEEKCPKKKSSKKLEKSLKKEKKEKEKKERKGKKERKEKSDKTTYTQDSKPETDALYHGLFVKSEAVLANY
ncbi:hypothetical protein AX774_g1573 [Zancudomyces culisetae]|uniref:G-patch domain-containing protein n=1 Tax=Zancudomyces culisetae TaxID=1213189 RepID=A0A1R1PBX8_ZANCU|nr:hypothetical protein AX774_g8133 [Zancudomyces culisetae]OMH81108.1 hypothetical protein AX774_g5437 [Zancudomyces culisetae]OMH84880.1 hypothetical protein AX774_g1573 [Zancudomyces culisetae]|eukprot:OMH78477.1 hypothetical protein AX774_g8133 [Zancudomyces culisetae]